MIKDLFEKKEKKVEYAELIYDLIFVYVIGRNNSLLHSIDGGFIDGSMFIAYVMCTLAVIQIWNYTAYYINLYGRNGIRDHLFLFVNMFLLYFIAQGTREDWQDYHTQYHIAWALILVNLGLQYVIEYRNHKSEPYHKRRIKSMAAILFAEALIVLADIPLFKATGTTYLSLGATVFGMVAVSLAGRKSCSSMVDFSHLSERAMLYVVFTFGEMIIGISGYFDGGLSFNGIYFSLMAFLIVAGLFLSYEVMYDHIIDREANTNGISFMVFHIFIIFALNNITAALEFMQNEEVSLLPKVGFITGSLILYYVFLFLLGRYAKKNCKKDYRKISLLLLLGACFAVLMLVLREYMVINIAVTVLFVYAIFAILFRFAGRVNLK